MPFGLSKKVKAMVQVAGLPCSLPRPCYRFGVTKHYFSLALLALWCVSQSAFQFSSSQKRTMSPLCGLTWSTTEAEVSLPSFLHSTHRGLARK